MRQCRDNNLDGKAISFLTLTPSRFARTREKAEVEKQGVCFATGQDQILVELFHEEEFACGRDAEHLQEIDHENGHDDGQHQFDMTNLQREKSKYNQKDEYDVEADDKAPCHVADEKARVVHRVRSDHIRFDTRCVGHIDMYSLADVSFMLLVILHAKKKLKAVDDHRQHRTPDHFTSDRESFFQL